MRVRAVMPGMVDRVERVGHPLHPDLDGTDPDVREATEQVAEDEGHRVSSRMPRSAYERGREHALVHGVGHRREPHIWSNASPYTVAPAVGVVGGEGPRLSFVERPETVPRRVGGRTAAGGPGPDRHHLGALVRARTRAPRRRARGRASGCTAAPRDGPGSRSPSRRRATG